MQFADERNLDQRHCLFFFLRKLSRCMILTNGAGAGSEGTHTLLGGIGFE